MKIVHITPFYKPSIGGVEEIVYNTVKELAKRGHEVHVVSVNYDNRWKEVAKPGTVVEEGVIVHRLRPSFIKIGYATLMHDLKEVLFEIKPDIVHSHNLHPHLFQAIAWKSKVGYKVVAQLHFPKMTGVDNLIAKMLFEPTMKILTWNQNNVDVFITHTRLEKQWLINSGINGGKISIIKYPCTPDSLAAYVPKRDIHGLLGSDIVITYVSRVHRRKGQHLLIKASEYLRNYLNRNFKVYIAGPISDQKYFIELHNLVQRLSLSGIVVLEPRILREEEKLDYMSTSNIFALTSLMDYTPVAVFESLALGTPVVATNVGALGEYAPDVQGLYLASHDPKDIAQKIVDALNKGRQVNAEAFRCNNIVTKVEELYTRILKPTL
jgi:glycosyltransferase involved in cell wall biosynthesis